MRRFISFRGPFGMRLITTTVAIFAGYFLTVQYPYLHALDRKSYETREQCEEAALGKLGAVKIDPHLDAAIGGTSERLHDGPVS
jgi:hypothetical protein